MFSSRAASIFIAGLLLAGNVFLLFLFSVSDKRADRLKADLNEKKHYFDATVNQLMELDITDLREGDMKPGVYLNLAGCSECNEKTFLYATRKFNKKELYVVIDEKYRNMLPVYLKESDYELSFVKGRHFFSSAVPFFFINVKGQPGLKFIHDNDYPQETERYVSKIVYYFKKIKSNV